MLWSDKVQQVAYPMRGESPPRGWFDPSGKLGGFVVLNVSDIASIKNGTGNVSGGGYSSMIQPSAILQPLYVASGINGLPSIRQTSGQNESLDSSNTIAGTNLSLFIQFVFRPLSSNTSLSNMSAWFIGFSW